MILKNIGKVNEIIYIIHREIIRSFGETERISSRTISVNNLFDANDMLCTIHRIAPLNATFRVP